ncbi:hypothetical protein SSYRP_v1c05140 [Spiroplasma syrphidicola EA-1]|uniref:Lipoprotein n=1 Tax=Spiroplasma syrphidicola EA-1 TaxID=1276229 RepID=R4UDY4_9MOLU|nr:lipoprotein [Spiroplasma syrphidicola]AGM26104.1 hypothetical protein SSYRP_v1c05140 [Spiroplasma syrphidicola EA-1]
MKKLLSILGAVAITASGASSVIACGTQNVASPIDKFNIKDSYDVIPNAYELKKLLVKDGNNVDILQIKFTPGLNEAIIRYMGEPNRAPFVTKKVTINPLTNDVYHIITKTSLAINGIPEAKQNKEGILEAINLLNQTNLTANDVEVDYEAGGNVTLTGQNNFTGSVIIYNEKMLWSDLIPVQNLGNIYLGHNIIDYYNGHIQKYPEDENALAVMLMMPLVFEYVGAKNLLMEFFQANMITWGLQWSGTPGAVTIKIDNNYNGTFILNPPENNSFINEKIKITFKALEDNRPYVTPTQLPTDDLIPGDWSTLKENLDNDYTINNIEEIVGDLVTKYFGEEFVNKYRDVLNEDFWIRTVDYNTKIAKLEVKPGSMLFMNHDKMAANVVNGYVSPVYGYDIEVTFGTK